MMSLTSRFLISLAVMAYAAPAAAQDSDVPYWASINVSAVNMRVGPATSYNIDWVYRREGLPLKVLRKKEGWRFVEDPDGTKGWVLGRFLSRERTAIVVGKDVAPMLEKADPSSRLLWQLEPGVVGELGDCESGWCEIEVHGGHGFVRQDRLWGPGKP